AGCAMAYYFWRVTGSPFRMPHQVYSDTYEPTTFFVWQSFRQSPPFHHKLMLDYAKILDLKAIATHSFGGFFFSTMGKLNLLWVFYLGPLLLVPFFMAAVAAPTNFSWKQFAPGTRFLLIVTIVSLTGLGFEVYYAAHYAAPLTCVIFALVLIALRYVRLWRWRERPTGLAISRAVPVIALLLLVVRVAASPLHLPLPSSFPPTWCSRHDQELDRAHILSQLEGSPGRHLVIVRYSPAH